MIRASVPGMTGARLTIDPPGVQGLRRFIGHDGAALGVLGVFVIAGFVWLAHPWYPVEDLAVTELAVRQVSHQIPLAGAYSSLPFHHPGPSLFLYLWVPYHLFGERSSALLAATIWFNGAVLASSLALARRLGGTVLPVLFAAAILLWTRAGGLPRLLQPWNPYVGALPVVALVLLAWALLERRAWALPAAVAMATWATQAHIQFGPVCAALGAFGVIGMVLRTVRADGASALRSIRDPAAAALAVGVVLWLPVAADVAAHGRASNPAAIVRHYRGPQPPAIAPSEVALVLRSELSLHPTWAGGPRPFHLLTLPVAQRAPLALGALLAATLLAGRRRAWPELRSISVGVVAVGASGLALTRVTGANLASWYLIAVEASALALDVLVLASLVASARHAVARRPRDVMPSGPRTMAWAGPVVGAILTIALAVATVASLHLVPNEERTARAAERALPAVEAAIGRGRPVLVEARPGLGGWVQAALVLQLDRAGYDVYARTTLVDKFPASLSAPPPATALRLVVVTDPPPGTMWLPGVDVVTESRYALDHGTRPIHVVIVRAPLGIGRLAVEP